MERQFTKEEAIAFLDSKVWTTWSYEQIVRLQLFQDRLCMPFDIFKEALSKALDRHVYTHELAYPDELKKEFLGSKEAPTFEDIVRLIPLDKRLTIFCIKRNET